MDYLTPDLALKRSQFVSLALALLLGISLLGVPWIMRQGPYLVSYESSPALLTQANPIELTTARLEQFTKAFLSARFRWDSETIPNAQRDFAALTTQAVSAKLKSELQNQLGLAQHQSASSHFVFEGFAFSNLQKKIEARFTRVLRIKHLATAQPMLAQIYFEETAMTKENPFGLRVKDFEEGPSPEAKSSERGQE